MVALLGVTACSGGAETDAPTSTLVPSCNTTDTVDDPNVLNGVYQVDWSYEDLAEATGLTGDIVEGNDGLITVTFFDGCFSLVWEEEPALCAGAYIVSGDRISMVATLRRADWGCGDDLLGDEFVSAAWELNEDNLTLSDFDQIEHVDDIVNVMVAAHFGTKPLLRVDGAD